MDILKLRESGITDNESLVYVWLLEHGQNGAGAISKKTGLHRRIVYDTLDRLIKKGLVSYILENKKRVFQPSDPRKLLEIKEEEKENINKIMPELNMLYNSFKPSDKNQTFFYRGKEGLKAVFEDQIEEAKKYKEILILGASPLAYELLEIYFHWFDKKRKKEKIKARVISNYDINPALSEVRFLPEKYSSPLAVNIYGEKVAIIMWSKEEPFAIVIKQKEIAEGYRNYFELLWKISSKKLT